MKQISFLAVLAFFLNFSLVSCSSKKAEQSQGAVEESTEEPAVEIDENTPVKNN